MCMSSLGAVTGFWNYTEADKEGKIINYNYKCPVKALENCTSDDAAKDCQYKSPFCCTIKTAEYTAMPDKVGEEVKMCMNTPRQGDKLMEGLWNDPTNAASFTYKCKDTPFDEPTSAFDEFFDYAIDYTQGNNVNKLTKAGLPFNQCEQNTDCPDQIVGNKACCVDSTCLLVPTIWMVTWKMLSTQL